jgi:flagellar basal-body rod protein FlgG
MAHVVQGGLRQERKLETIANHLANAHTTGFKGDVLSFDSLFTANMNVDFTAGEIQQTGNDLDIALEKEGFLKVQTPNGVRYTRNGTLTIDQDNLLITQDGDPVLGENGPITLGGSHIDINEAGEVRVDNQVVGKLSIVDFASKENLTKEGTSYFVDRDNTAREIRPEDVKVIQGALEMPNVSTIFEMTKMIETLRGYESYQKMLQAYDETDSKLINEVGKA